MDTCNLGKAFEFRKQGVELARQLLEEAPADTARKRLLATALSGWAAVQWRMSLVEPSIEGLRESEKLFSEMAQSDPANQTFFWGALLRRQWIAQRLATAGDMEKAWADSKKLASEFNAAYAAGMSDDYGAAVEYAEFRIDHSILANRAGELTMAQTALQDAMDSLVSLVQEKPKNRLSIYQLVRGAYQQWYQFGQLPNEQGNEQANAAIEQFLAGRKSIESCDDASLAAQLAVMRGDKKLASGYTSYLLEKGYFDPDFIRFCSEQQMCN
jgi:hypothetical protein